VFFTLKLSENFPKRFLKILVFFNTKLEKMKKSEIFFFGFASPSTLSKITLKTIYPISENFIFHLFGIFLFLFGFFCPWFVRFSGERFSTFFDQKTAIRTTVYVGGLEKYLLDEFFRFFIFSEFFSR
jgi:hypothetical protein